MNKAPYFTTLWVTGQFVGYHKWPDAPAEVGFLRHLHRHLFKVKLSIFVSHDNRQEEFFIVQDSLIHYLRETFEHGFDVESTTSCEQMARRIAAHFLALDYKVRSVEVSEDGENGATVHLLGASPYPQELVYHGADESVPAGSPSAILD